LLARKLIFERPSVASKNQPWPQPGAAQCAMRMAVIAVIRRLRQLDLKHRRSNF